MENTKREIRYDEIITFRIPREVYNALRKFIEEQQEDFPRFNEPDACRAALVAYLKKKKYLNDKEQYL